MASAPPAAFSRLLPPRHGFLFVARPESASFRPARRGTVLNSIVFEVIEI